jgi:hypothetical protein
MKGQSTAEHCSVPQFTHADITQCAQKEPPEHIAQAVLGFASTTASLVA